MRTKFCVLLVLFTVITHGQKIEETFFNKPFMANVNSVCEETPDDNPCAGEEIYVVVKFLKDKVELAEKGVSSCGEETYVLNFTYSWNIKEDEIVILTNPKEVKSTHLKKIKFSIQDKKLIGYINYPNGKVIAYHFKEEKK
ncbi:hypothetical protein [uncultured Tenacibaculum sp.]|uniref:hypothetical protein n=1 Tax=uncultured Tenacibaculum sp. TaxID=174713 RepID=UPI002624AB15|nr:hypothetical protein [uncultured Tenacibaculum sp.]